MGFIIPRDPRTAVLSSFVGRVELRLFGALAVLDAVVSQNVSDPG